MTEIRVGAPSTRWPLRWQPLHRRWLIVIAVAAAALGAGAARPWGLLRLDRETILSAAGRAWVVSDQLAPADAAAVLGGGHDTRPAAAAQLFNAGLVKKILVSTGETAGEDQPSPDRDELIKLGVPLSAIIQFSVDPRNTYGEARSLALWAGQNGASQIIVPTEIFPSRRVQWIMRRQLGKVGAGVMVEALSPHSYDQNDWWKNGQGIDNFRSEIIKYLYYRLAY